MFKGDDQIFLIYEWCKFSIVISPSFIYSTLMRGKSISTEDLKTEDNFDNDLDEPIEWKRVSKIRRSLQFPRTTAPK